jgi:hypothetical protein
MMPLPSFCVNIFPNLLFPTSSQPCSITCSIHLHIQNFLWDSLPILKICSYNLILLHITLHSEMLFFLIFSPLLFPYVFLKDPTSTAISLLISACPCPCFCAIH